MYRVAQQLHFAARYQRFAERAALDRAGHHASAAERNYLLGRPARFFGAKLRVADERYPVCLSAVNLRLGVNFHGTVPEASGPLRREIFDKKLVRVIIRAAQSFRKQLQQFWSDYFLTEKGVYEQLLENPDEAVSGTVKELAEKYKTSGH